MNTQRKTTTASNDPLVRKLAAELAIVADLVTSQLSEENRGLVPKNDNDPAGRFATAAAAIEASATTETGAVLIGRLVHGLDSVIWNELMRQCKLESWLAIPLGDGASSNLQHIASALDRLVYQRDHDPLTSLANRRYYEVYLRKELERARRNFGELSLAMLDLDNFKRINDNYGHPCGDYVLREFGSFLKKSHRSFELVARLGGDEFSIVLPGSNPRATKNMLERVGCDFCARKLKFEDLPEISVNFSAGVAAVGAGIGYLGMDELISQADQALYEAKRKGKNQVCINSATSAQGHPECMVVADEKKFLFNYAG